MTGIDFSKAPGPRALERLQTEQVAWLVTIGKNGTPQPSPVWFLWENDSITIYSMPNTGKTRAIARNPQVVFHFNTGADGDDVAVFSGTAAVDEQGPKAIDNEAYLTKYANGLVAINMDPRVMSDTYSTRIVITPEHLRGW